MSDLNATLKMVKEKNEALAFLLTVMLDGGRFYVTGNKAEELFSLVPEIVYFEKIEPPQWKHLKKLSARDVVFVETEAVDLIWDLNQKTGAQIVLLSDKALDPTLVDFRVSERDLRSALLSLGPEWQKISPLQTQFAPMGLPRKPALFLDRDGVVIEFVDYIKEAGQVKLMPGIVNLLKSYHAQGFSVVIVTNQSGLGRGLYDWKNYDEVTLQMQKLLAAEGAFVDLIQKAPYFEQTEIASFMGRRGLRKPRPGMFHSAAETLGLDLSKSLMVGDFATDMMAADLAGVGKAYLLNSNHLERELKKWREWPLLSRSRYGLNLKVIKSFADI